MIRIGSFVTFDSGAVDFGKGGKLRAESEEEAVESVRACDGVEELELEEELEEDPC